MVFFPARERLMMKLRNNRSPMTQASHQFYRPEMSIGSKGKITITNNSLIAMRTKDVLFFVPVRTSHEIHSAKFDLNNVEMLTTIA